jgi:hypothetical protein
MTTYTYKFNPIDEMFIPGIKGPVNYPIEFMVEITIEEQYKVDTDDYMKSIGFVPAD